MYALYDRIMYITFSEIIMAKNMAEAVSAENKNNRKLNPIVSIALGAALLLASMVAAPIAVADRVSDVDAVEQFADKSYVRRDGEFDTSYNGHPIITYGTLTHDGGATDTVFGITADSAMLFRVSEMAQWVRSEDALTLVWSEEVVSAHENEVINFPSNTKSNHYAAKGVKLGGYEISVDQLLMLENRTALTELPDVDTRGFKTVNHNGTDYITNSENLDAPKEGDVRIRYEYLKLDKVTFVGKQRDTAIVSHTNFNDFAFFAAFEGEVSKADTVKYFRGETSSNTWWLYMIAIMSAVAGGILLLRGFCDKVKYVPNEKTAKVKNISKELLAMAHGVIFGVLTLLTVLLVAWASVYPIALVIIVALDLLYLFALGEDLFKNMPRPKKKEAEYVPILIKRDGENRDNRNSRKK